MTPPKDIYTEPEEIDPDTVANLGPLAPLAGAWEGRGSDVHPVSLPEATEEESYIERITFDPIDPQPNGPQLLYGLRYHVFVVKPGEKETFHDQIGYWLWEPATGALYQTVAIPRAQVALALGRAERFDKSFTVKATLGSPTAGIVSGPFLDENFRTTEYTCTFTLNRDGTLSYEQDTVIEIAGRKEPFHHTDRNTLRKMADALPNPALR